jgi:hypothetical protein
MRVGSCCAVGSATWSALLAAAITALADGENRATKALGSLGCDAQSVVVKALDIIVEPRCVTGGASIFSVEALMLQSRSSKPQRRSKKLRRRGPGTPRAGPGASAMVKISSSPGLQSPGVGEIRISTGVRDGVSWVPKSSRRPRSDTDRKDCERSHGLNRQIADTGERAIDFDQTRTPEPIRAASAPSASGRPDLARPAFATAQESPASVQVDR